MKRPAAPSCRPARSSLLLASLCAALYGCGDSGAATAPSPQLARVEFVYLASTELRGDLPPQTADCVRGVGRTHIHPSWRNFARVDLQAAGPDRWEIVFTDVPVNVRLAIRISDPNVCAENPTGAATRNVFANGVELVAIVQTPGAGLEPGLAFTVGADGRVSP